MMSDLLLKLENKVANAIEVIELLRLQLEELEEENSALRAEHEKWRGDLANLIKRFDQVENHPAPEQNSQSQKEFTEEEYFEEEYIEA